MARWVAPGWVLGLIVPVNKSLTYKLVATGMLPLLVLLTILGGLLDVILDTIDCIAREVPVYFRDIWHE